MSHSNESVAPRLTLCGGTKLSRTLQPGVAFTIGQAREASLRIPHPAVSDFHCTVLWQDGKVTLTDSGTPAGTLVNGSPLHGSAQLREGDLITVGLFQLLFSSGSPSPAAAPPVVSPPPAEAARDAAPVPSQSDAPGVLPEIPTLLPSYPMDAPTRISPARRHTLPVSSPDASAGSANDSFPDSEDHDTVVGAEPGSGRSSGSRRRGGGDAANPFAGPIPLIHGLTLGSSRSAGVILKDPALSRIQAVIEKSSTGFEVVDQGRTGSLVNGKYFDRHELIIGDLLQFGERYFFVFDGSALMRVRDSMGCGIQAWGLEVNAGKRRGLILQNASVDVQPGQFTGIIGPSGAGKTTLLRALLGFVPISSGTILLDGQDLRTISDPSPFFGYVPQQEIIHLELTARQALHYSALLRLPRRTPRQEMEKLIHSLSQRLGLSQHLDTRAGRLSGGQLKRLSVCVELLSRPPLLFLDEPTSGLDPESETELMQQLQELSYTGCTVVCTTHLMENVYLMSSLEVVMAGRDDEGKPEPGTTVFRGKPQLARELFGVRSLTKLYAGLKARTPAQWQQWYQEKTGTSLVTPPPARHVAPRSSSNLTREPRRAPVPILLARQWAILKADWKNPALLLGQPLLIAFLITLVATGADPSDKKLFLASIAIFWLGCGNAAPELVRERAIFRREKFTGLRATSYLLSKLLGLGFLTTLQALVILGILQMTGGGLDGSAAWQWAACVATALASTGLGLAISAWAGTTLQAVLLVPVVIIPQILFAGFVFPVKDWDEHTVPRLVSRVFPSFASQRIFDVSLLWDKPVEDASTYLTALNNLTTSLRPWRVLLRPSEPAIITLNERDLYVPPPADMEPFGERNFEWDPGKRNVLPPRYMTPTMRDERPRIFQHATPAWHGLLSLLAWTLGTCGAALLLLCRKVRE